MTSLILASTSPFRRELLTRLRLPFDCHGPQVDETPLPGEAPVALVQRLSHAKAAAGAAAYPRALVIGSDQVAVLDSQVLGKPGTPERAVEQLTALSGREVRFHTGLCLINAASGIVHEDVIDTVVRLRKLDTPGIERYLQVDQPWGCAGSFRSEALGIALFESVASEDPAALVGLPLIRLVDFLLAEGVQVP